MQSIKNFFAQQAQRRAERAADAEVRNRKITMQDLSRVVAQIDHVCDTTFVLSPSNATKYNKTIIIGSDAGFITCEKEAECQISELKVGEEEPHYAYEIRVYKGGSCDIENRKSSYVMESGTLGQVLANIADIAKFHAPEQTQEIDSVLKTFLEEQKQQQPINAPTLD